MVEADSILAAANSTAKEEIKTLTELVKNLQQKMTNMEKSMPAVEGNKKEGQNQHYTVRRRNPPPPKVQRNIHKTPQVLLDMRHQPMAL